LLAACAGATASGECIPCLAGSYQTGSGRPFQQPLRASNCVRVVFSLCWRPPSLALCATHCLLISFAALLPTLARARHEFTGRAALPGLLCTLQCVLHVLSPAVHSCMCATYRVAFLLERRGCPFRTRLASESMPLLAVAEAFACAVSFCAWVLLLTHPSFLSLSSPIFCVQGMDSLLGSAPCTLLSVTTPAIFSAAVQTFLNREVARPGRLLGDSLTSSLSRWRAQVL